MIAIDSNTSNDSQLCFTEQLFGIVTKLIWADLYAKNKKSYILVLKSDRRLNVTTWQISILLADRFSELPILSIFQEVSDVFSEAWLPIVRGVTIPITIMDLIGNWVSKYSHASHLASYMAH